MDVKHEHDAAGHAVYAKSHTCVVKDFYLILGNESQKSSDLSVPLTFVGMSGKWFIQWVEIVRV